MRHILPTLRRTTQKCLSLSPRPIRTGPSPSSLPTLRLAPSAGSLSPFPPSAGAPLLPPLALSSPFLPPWAGGPLLPPPALSVRAAASRPRGAGHGATAGERAALRGERAWELRRQVHGVAWGRSSVSRSSVCSSRVQIPCFPPRWRPARRAGGPSPLASHRRPSLDSRWRLFLGRNWRGRRGTGPRGGGELRRPAGNRSIPAGIADGAALLCSAGDGSGRRSSVVWVRCWRTNRLGMQPFLPP